MRRYLVNPCAAGVALAIATTAFAPTALSQSETAMLEEVVVTARKREESLAETPLAITAISADEREIQIQVKIDRINHSLSYH